ncbi:phosphatidylinositol phosphatase PTPRQ-like [Amphiura filiformis]|uniref:phosphatidylinositol phosphatase PTPRQ-like n=1 Tax=Amphiura filiformis TaxID=82378 RepID=UPI003B21D4DE
MMAFFPWTGCLFLQTFIFGITVITVTHGQCTIQNFEVTSVPGHPNSYYKQLNVSWECDADNNEFRITYQLTNWDQCYYRANEEHLFGIQALEWHTLDYVIMVHSSLYLYDIIISDLEPYSTYNVTIQSRASNSYGTIQRTSVVTGESVPSYPGPSIQIYNASKTLIDFLVEIQCGSRHGNITGYEYQLSYERYGGQPVNEAVFTPMTFDGKPGVRVTGLSYGTSYWLLAVGANGAGRSNSRWITVGTHLVPCTIQNFEVTPDPSSPVFNNQLQVSWECDSNNNEFEITYQLINRDQCDTGDGSQQWPFHHLSFTWSSWDDVETYFSGVYRYSAILDPTQRNNDLYPYSTYNVTIQSSQSGFFGTVQSTSVITGEEVLSYIPYILTKNVSTTHIDIFWDQRHVSCGNRHGNITGYEYQMTYSEDGQPVSEAVFTPMTFDGKPGVRVTGLSSGTSYILQVAGVNGAGTGSYGSITAWTRFGLCTIQHFEVTPDPSSPARQLHVSWECDADNNEFQITYQLTNIDQCDTGDGSQGYPFNRQSIRGWSSWHDAKMHFTDVYRYSTFLNNLYVYSTYNVTIQSRELESYGYEQSTTVTTGEIAPTESPSIVAYNVSTTHIDFYWDPIHVSCGNRHGNVTGYEYQLTYIEDNQLVSEAVFTPMAFNGKPGVRVTGLSLGTWYRLQVAGVNGAGTGSYGSITDRTRFGLCTIQHFEVTPDPSSPARQLHVSWECDADNNEFQITYQLTNIDQCDTGDGSQQWPFQQQYPLYQSWSRWDYAKIYISGLYRYSDILYNLYAYSIYNVTIQSREFESYGYEQSTSVTTGEIVPDQGPDIQIYNVSKTHIDLNWDERPCGSRYGNITGYEYQLTNDDDGQPVSEAVFMPMMFDGKPGVRVTGLSCGTHYDIQVAAVNGAGRGPNSLRYISTHYDPPGNVENIQLSSEPATQIKITWMKPDKGCPAVNVDAYEVTCEGNTRLEGKCQHLLSSHTVMDRTSSLSYVCHVRPFFSYNIQVDPIGVGTGAGANIMQDTPQSAPSSHPVNVRITAGSDTTHTITWDEIPCTGRNGVILGYHYQLLFGTNIIDEDDLTTTSVTIDITGLVPGYYGFAVAGRTVAGIGSYASLLIQVGTPAPEAGLHIQTYNTSKTHLDFYWDEIESDQRYGNIIGYEYQLTYSEDGQPVSEAVFTPMAFDGKPGVRVTGLSCGTWYQLQVAGVNGAGTGTPWFPLDERTNSDPPGSVQNLQLSSEPAKQINITWMEPEKGCPAVNVDTYEVTCEGNTRLEDKCLHLLPKLSVRDRTSNLSYVCYVRPYFSYNIKVEPVDGGPITEITKDTPQSAPSSPPGNVRITAGSDTTHTITWDEIPCAGRNGVILGYHYQLLFGANIVEEDDLTKTSVTIDITGLAPRYYGFAVAGRTLAGIGSYANLGISVPDQGPYIQTYNVSKTHIDFYWDEIKTGSRHVNITDYEYQLMYLEDGQRVNEAVFTPMTFDGKPGERVTGLSCGTWYKVQVADKNGAGKGIPGLSFNERTNSDPPGTVQNLQVSSLSETQINITWMEPVKGCPPVNVDTYEVTCEGNTRQTDKCQYLLAEHGPIIVRDRTSYLSYLCHVRPFYSYNIQVEPIDGGPITGITQKTPESAPSSPPGNVRITAGSDTTRTITWDGIPCTGRNGVILGYHYQLVFGTNIIDEDDLTTTSVTIDISGLAPGYYNFGVAGTTVAGIGSYASLLIQVGVSIGSNSGTAAKSSLMNANSTLVAPVVVLAVLLLAAIIAIVVLFSKGRFWTVLGEIRHRFSMKFINFSSSFYCAAGLLVLVGYCALFTVVVTGS